MEKSRNEINKLKPKMETKVLVRASFYAAISIILTRFLSPMIGESIRIGFGPIPIMLSGIFYGPIIGGLVGFVADIVGVLINPMGPSIHPGFTFSSILTGAIPGVMYLIFLKNKGKKTDAKLPIIISMVLITVIVNILLNTLWLSQMFGNPFMAQLVIRMPKIIVQFIMETVLMLFLYKPLSKV
ncbi:ECF transporter S component, folate family [Anaerosphaera aminiphila DSM 21120]|uniref:ECF transporter S component, folate family n=1 Tax=Anaerosphaera aminiphila DSM 21120 TaxID=1120995 RepID=A0A1M5QUK7_9FIRM|nr:folate family ECF transporter S component [Anaerosphaera aminiphila]SHH17233.1 ECF transporter S component, folate family [Anaerosphaera aminiphila DSM 21120]